MQSWKVSVGLTVTVAGLATILTHRPARIPRRVPPRDPRRLRLGDCPIPRAGVGHPGRRLLLSHPALGLGDLGKKVDLVERLVRRGEGDRELAEALQRDAEGKWE